MAPLMNQDPEDPAIAVVVEELGRERPQVEVELDEIDLEVESASKEDLRLRSAREEDNLQRQIQKSSLEHSSWCRLS